jgi:hypothetical protein
MMAHLLNLALLAADSPGPRGDNPSDLGGILIIVGIVLVATAVVVGAGWLLATRGRSRRGTFRRKPHRRGRVGRI